MQLSMSVSMPWHTSWKYSGARRACETVFWRGVTDVIANIQSSVLNSIGSQQYAQVTRANQTAENSQIKESRVEIHGAQEGTVYTSVHGDTLTISRQGSAYVDRSAVTAAVISDKVVAEVSGTATDEATKAFVAAEEKEQPAEIEQRRHEQWKERLEELTGKDLSGYTESELAGMLSRGEISRAEYEKEIKGRESFDTLTGVSA